MHNSLRIYYYTSILFIGRTIDMPANSLFPIPKTIPSHISPNSREKKERKKRNKC